MKNNSIIYSNVKENRSYNNSLSKNKIYNNYFSNTNKQFVLANSFYEYNKEVSNLDEVQKLKKLFLHYSNNEKKLSSHKFHKLITDAKIIDNTFTSQYADILFFSTGNSKQNLDFTNFCDLLVKLSEIKYPEIFIRDQSAALSKILENNLNPLLDVIIDQSMYSNKPDQILIYKHFTYPEVLLVLDQHYYIMKQIYEKYFPWEKLTISNFQKRDLSEKAFQKFLYDYEIVPNLVSIKKLKEIFENTIMNVSEINTYLAKRSLFKKLGSFFTLYNFIAGLYIISTLAYFDFEKDKINGECLQSLFKQKIYGSPYIKYIIDLNSTPNEMLMKEAEKKELNESVKAINNNLNKSKNEFIITKGSNLVINQFLLLLLEFK